MEQGNQTVIMKTLCPLAGSLRVDTEQELADFYDDVNKIVRTSCCVRITNQSSYKSPKGLETQINGTCEFSVLYLSGKRGADGKLFFASFDVPFAYQSEGALGLEFEAEELWTLADVKAENAICRPLGPRKLQLRCELKVEGCVKGNVLYPLYFPSEQALEMQTEKRSVTALTTVLTKELSLNEEFHLPLELPAAFQMGEYDADIYVKEVKISDGRAALELGCSVLCSYLGDAGESHRLISFVQPLDIRESVELGGGNNSQHVCAHCRIADIELELREDTSGENRLIGLRLSYLITVAVYETKELELLTDCYCAEYELKTETRSLETECVLWDFSSETKTQGSCQLAEPELTSVEMIRSELLTESCVAQAKGIRTQGALRLTMLGIKESGEVLSIKEELKVDLLFPYPEGVKETELTESLHFDWQGAVSKLDCELKGGELLINAWIKAWCMMTKKSTGEDIVSINRGEEKGQRHGDVIVYYPDAQEGLWEIGKKFSVPMRQLQEIQNGNGGKLPRVITLLH